MTLGKWVKKAKDARAARVPADAPLDETERMELIRLREEVEPKDSTIAELQMEVEFAKCSDLVREREAVKFAAIADWADSDSYLAAFTCRELGVSRSGYYAWRSRRPSKRATDDAALIEITKKLFADARANPGVPRMRAELAARGHRLSHKRVWRLMRAAGLRARYPRAWKRTYVKTWDGWGVHGTLIDLHFRQLVGWAIADRMCTELVTAALDVAIANHRPPDAVVFHSDRGCQYTSQAFADYCKKRGIRCSQAAAGFVPIMP